MGVVNASPESFSDGGLYATVDQQVERALELVAAGAGIIDVGGESGVTGMAPAAGRGGVSPGRPARRASRRRRPRRLGRYVEAGRRSGGAGCRRPHHQRRERPARSRTGRCMRRGRRRHRAHAHARPAEEEGVPRTTTMSWPTWSPSLAIAWPTPSPAAWRWRASSSTPAPTSPRPRPQTVAVLRRLDAVLELGRPVLLADLAQGLHRRPHVSAHRAERDAGTLAAIGAGVDAGASILRVHDVGRGAGLPHRAGGAAR